MPFTRGVDDDALPRLHHLVLARYRREEVFQGGDGEQQDAEVVGMFALHVQVDEMEEDGPSNDHLLYYHAFVTGQSHRGEDLTRMVVRF